MDTLRDWKFWLILAYGELAYVLGWIAASR